MKRARLLVLLSILREGLDATGLYRSLPAELLPHSLSPIRDEHLRVRHLPIHCYPSSSTSHYVYYVSVRKSRHLFRPGSDGPQPIRPISLTIEATSMFNRPHPFMSRPGPLGHDLVVDSFSLSYTCVSDDLPRSQKFHHHPCGHRLRWFLKPKFTVLMLSLTLKNSTIANSYLTVVELTSRTEVSPAREH